MSNTSHIENIEDIYQNAPCGYLSTNVDGIIVQINNTLLSWLGYERQEIISNKRLDNLLNVGGKIYFQTHFMPLLEMQGFVYEISMELIGKDAAKIPVLINANKVTDQDGEGIYRFSILDITQRKQYEKELLLARKEAEEKNKKLKQVNEDLERFGNKISHDLQAPMNTLSGILYLFKEQELLKKGKQSEDLVKQIERITNQMRFMIRDLLEYSKSEDKKEFEPVSMNEALNKSIELLHNDIKRSHAKIEASDLPVVNAIESQMTSLCLNLLSNAIKYRSEEDPVISISYKKEGKFYKFSVKDNGLGIRKKDQPRIFGFLERLHDNSEIEGKGIGLFIIKRIVESHNGTIGVTSTPGKGSTFYFTLPIAG